MIDCNSLKTSINYKYFKMDQKKYKEGRQDMDLLITTVVKIVWCKKNRNHTVIPSCIEQLAHVRAKVSGERPVGRVPASYTA
jgi:hypothetical protein